MTQVSSQRPESSGWPVWMIVIALVGALIVVAAEKPLPTPNLARISGRLTLEGQPMQPGFSVVFMEPRRGDLAFGITDADGRFIVNSWKNGDMVPGLYKAYVTPPVLMPEESRRPFAFDRGGEPPPTLPIEYPEKYRKLQTTTLEYKIVVGDNRVEIDLERAESARDVRFESEPADP